MSNLENGGGYVPPEVINNQPVSAEAISIPDEPKSPREELLAAYQEFQKDLFVKYQEAMPDAETLIERLEYLEENGTRLATISYAQESELATQIGENSNSAGLALLASREKRQTLKGAVAKQWNLKKTQYGEWPISMYNNKQLSRLEFFKLDQQSEVLDARRANNKSTSEANTQTDVDVSEAPPLATFPTKDTPVSQVIGRELDLHREINTLRAQVDAKREEVEYWKAIALRREEQLRAPIGRTYLKFIDSNGHAVRPQGNFPPDSAYVVVNSDDGLDHIKVLEAENTSKPALDVVLDHGHDISMKELYDITRAWFLSDKKG